MFRFVETFHHFFAFCLSVFWILLVKHQKYEINGVEGLIDHRGKSKKQEDLTEADRLRMENKILQAKLKDQEMEIKLLKKLRELRGGGH